MTTVVDLVLGLILLATWVMLPLWTIEMLQIAHYFKNSGKQDPWYLRATIALVALADTGATALICEWSYTYAITNFGNMAILGVQGVRLPIHNVLVSWTACVCQVYLATRFYKISKNLPVYIGLLLLTAAAQISAIYISVIEVTHTQVSDRDLVINGAIIWLSCEAATDIGISVALVFYLVKFRVRTAFDDTKSMLTKLILVAVESGILTSLFAIATLVAAVAALQTNICLFFVFVLGRVYGCTLLYNLNIRKGGSLMGSSTFAKTGGSTNAQVNTYHLNALSRAEDLQGVTIERSTHVYVDAAEKDEPDSKATSRY